MFKYYPIKNKLTSFFGLSTSFFVLVCYLFIIEDKPAQNFVDHSIELENAVIESVGMFAKTSNPATLPGELSALHSPNLCYLIADGSPNGGGIEDTLYTLDVYTGTLTKIDGIGTFRIEAAAIDPVNEILYAVDGDTLGIVDDLTGAFTKIGGDLGNINGSLGPYNVDDVDGLTFDTIANVLWASERRSGTVDDDLIFQIDPGTGIPVANAFGAGIDYLVIDTPEGNIDDIAMDENGVLYVISNDGSGGSQKLGVVNTTTGAYTELGDFGVEDVEGLSFLASGQLMATTGDAGDQADQAYTIDPVSAESHFLYNLAPDIDIEACACRHSNFINNVIGNLVWADLDSNGILDPGEPGLADIQLNLLDPAGNPVLDSGSNPIRDTTDAFGAYQFTGLPNDSFIIELVLPVGMGYSPKGVGDPATDSDANVATGRTDTLIMIGGLIANNIDFGVLNSGATERQCSDINDLLLSDASGNILRYDNDTRLLIDTFIIGMSEPKEMVIGPDNYLYISDATLNEIRRYSLVTGALIDVFATGLNDPIGMTFDATGKLYVNNKNNDEVLYFEQDGSFLGDFILSGAGGLDGNRQGLEFGPDGNLYVSAYNEDFILRFNGTIGTLIDTFVTAGAGGLTTPQDFTFGPDGNLYVASRNNDNVLRFNGTTGAFIDEFVSAGSGGLNSPRCLVFAEDGDLYVTSRSGPQAALRYNGSTGAFVEVVTTGTTNPEAIAFAFVPGCPEVCDNNIDDDGDGFTDCDDPDCLAYDNLPTATCLVPFDCSDITYMTHGNQNNTDLYFIDVSMVPNTFNLLKNFTTGRNGLGFNPQDNFLYAFPQQSGSPGSNGTLERIDANGDVSVLQFSTADSLTIVGTKMHSATFLDDGTLVVVQINASNYLENLFTIDVSGMTPFITNIYAKDAIGISTNLEIWDILYDPLDQLIYGFTDNTDQLWSFNPAAAYSATQVATFSMSDRPRNVGAAWMQLNGKHRLYGSDVSDGLFYLWEYDPQLMTFTRGTQLVSGTWRDGASCVDGIYFEKMTDTTCVSPGDTITYVFNIYNSTGAAFNVTFTDSLATGLSYVGATWVDTTATGVPNSYAASNVLHVTNLNIPAGTATNRCTELRVDVAIDGGVTDSVINNQAYLWDFSNGYSEPLLSDYPLTVGGQPDSTPIAFMPTVSLSLGTVEVCESESAFTLTGGSPSGGTWSGTGVSGNQFDPGTAGVGIHTITYTYQNSSGCTATATDDIEVKALPSVNFSLPSYQCRDSVFSVEITSPDGWAVYNWDFGPDADPATALGPGPHLIHFNADGTQSIKVVGSLNGCLDSLTETLPILKCGGSTISSWDYGCDADTCVELQGIGVKSNLPATLYFNDPGSIHQIVVEATFSGNSGSPSYVTFTNPGVDTVDVWYTNFENSSDRYFMTTMAAADSIILSIPSGASSSRGESFMAYVFRQCENQISSGSFVHRGLSGSSYSFSINIPTSIVSRDIVVEVPISELKNSSTSIVQINATAGSVTDGVVLTGYNLGNSLNITPITLYDVPGHITTVTIDVISPSSGGQSLYLSGAGSVNLLCPELYLSKTADVTGAAVGDTITYIYGLYNPGDDAINSLTLTDDQLGAITLPATTLGPNDSMFATEDYIVLASDLPGPIKNIATVNGVGGSGNPLSWTDSLNVGLMGLSITKTADKTIGNVGDTVTYTYVLENTGSLPFDIELIDDQIGDITPDTGLIDPGLVLRYDFNEGSGDSIFDVSSVGTPLDLEISNPANVTWGSSSLTINSAIDANSLATFNKLWDHFANTTIRDQISVETWVQPANNTQDGPSRIFTFASGSGAKNFTMAQENNEWVFRLRTTGNAACEVETNINAISSSPTLQHVVATYDGSQIRIYVNGVEASVIGDTNPGGDFSTWVPNHTAMAFNENNYSNINHRDWLGEIHHFAVFNKALSPLEITNYYASGVDYETPHILVSGHSLSFTQQDTIASTDVPGPLTNIATLTGIVPGTTDTLVVADTVNVAICNVELTPVITDVCPGESDGIIAVTVSNGQSPYSFNWSTGSTNDSLLNVGAGSYGLTLTDFNGCIVDSTFTISEHTLPAVAASYNTPLCPGETLNLNETGGDAVAWSWTGPGGFSSPLQSPSITNVTNANAGNYTVVVSDVNACISVDVVTVEVCCGAQAPTLSK